MGRQEKHTPPYLMAAENGAVELEIQSPSTGAKLGQDTEGGAWEGVFESRSRPIPQWEFCAPAAFSVWLMKGPEIITISG